MSVIATDSQRPSNVLKKTDTDFVDLCNELVTVNEAGIKTYKVGTVLGKVTATGKYKISVVGAGDGSENAIAIVMGDSFGTPQDFSVAATTDTKVLVLARGKAVVSKSALLFDASYDTAPELAAAYASLATVQIFAEASA